MLLAGLLLTAGAVAVWILLVSEYGIGTPLPIVGCLALLCLGLLLGASWISQTLQPNLRQLAAERRRLNEEWAAVRTARQQRGFCPRCASPLPERDCGGVLSGTPGDQKAAWHPLDVVDRRR